MTDRMSRFLQIASSEPHAVSRQRLLEKAADRLLRQDRFYKKREKDPNPVVDADYISANGHLKPISGRP